MMNFFYRIVFFLFVFKAFINFAQRPETRNFNVCAGRWGGTRPFSTDLYIFLWIFRITSGQTSSHQKTEPHPRWRVEGVVTVILKTSGLSLRPSSGTKLDSALNSVVLSLLCFAKKKTDKKKRIPEMLCTILLFLFFVHPLCILALPCIIDEFYILLEKVK